MTSTYDSLKTYLDSPPIEMFPRERPLLEEDDRYPSPKRIDQARKYMTSSVRKGVFCGIVAAEMIVPLWERDADVYGDRERRLLHDFVTHAYDVFYGRKEFDAAWVDAKVTQQWGMEMRRTGVRMFAAGRYAVRATTEKSSSSFSEYLSLTRLEFAEWAVRAAADGQREDGRRKQFYREWWSECRRRLPIVDIDIAELL